MDTATEDEVTEFEIIDVESVKGVPMGANGFPHLIMKGVAAEDAPAAAADPAEPSAVDLAVKAVTRGKIDEAPDIDLGQQIMVLLGKAIANEADEIAAGSYGETCDVDLLNCAAMSIQRWLGRESGPVQQDAWDGVVMASALDDLAAKAKLSAGAINDLPDSAFAYIEPDGTKDSGGKTTPRSKRHFPVHDKAHADNAAARIAQGAEFGDEAKAKVAAAQKRFGESDAGKSAVAGSETSVQTDPDGTIAKAVEDAVAKATEASEGRIKQAEAQAAEAKAEVGQLRELIKSTPVPGGPVMSANARPSGSASAESDGKAAKAALMRQKADEAISPSDAAGYRAYARQLDEEAAAAAKTA
jgi:hypothetical protein